MAKKHSLRRKRHGMHSRKRRMRGGQSVAETAAPYSDAASYVLSQYGNGNTQTDNVFGPNSTSTMGNEIVNLNHPQQNPASMYPMKGGRRMRRKGTRKMGGNLAYAVAPFALWGIQKSMSCRNKSRRR